jgi:Spy/CpxP family protein refolding chaperone
MEELMKTRTGSLLMAGLLMAAPGAVLRADDAMPAMEKQDHSFDAKKMQKKLGLTDDQTVKLKAIAEAQKAAMKPLWDKQKDLTKKLKEQVDAKASDTDIQATLTELQTNRTAMRDQMEQFRTQKDAILTPTQQAKMLLHMHKGMHHDKDKK